MADAKPRLETLRPLVRYEGARPPRPRWFEEALAVPAAEGAAEVDGARIAWKRWGDPDADRAGGPGVLLVHGGVAHKSWWDFIAPFLLEGRCVVALDLSGMGDSDWREAYRMDLYAQEALAAAESAGIAGGGKKPILIGHSFGGWVSLAAARDRGDEMAGAVMLDSPIRPPSEQRRQSPPARPRRLYKTQADGLARFHLLPDQECANDFLLDHIAREGLLRTTDEDGAEAWTWKFDAELWNKLTYSAEHPSEYLGRIACPLAAFRGEHSALLPGDVWAYMKTIMPADTPMVSIPEAHHHLMMDQPLAVISALRALLASWP